MTAEPKDRYCKASMARSNTSRTKLIGFLWTMFSLCPTKVTIQRQDWYLVYLDSSLKHMRADIPELGSKSICTNNQNHASQPSTCLQMIRCWGNYVGKFVLSQSWHSVQNPGHAVAPENGQTQCQKQVNQENQKNNPETKSNSGNGRWQINRIIKKQECHYTLSENCPNLLVDSVKQMCCLCTSSMH